MHKSPRHGHGAGFFVADREFGDLNTRFESGGVDRGDVPLQFTHVTEDRRIHIKAGGV